MDRWMGVLNQIEPFVNDHTICSCFHFWRLSYSLRLWKSNLLSAVKVFEICILAQACHHGAEQIWGCTQLLALLIKDKSASDGRWAFWSGLDEAIVAFFFLSHEGHDGCWGSTSACVRDTLVGFTCICSIAASHFVHVLRGPARLKGQPCCKAIKGSNVVCPTLQMCYFERETSSESEVWPQVLAQWALLIHWD